MISVGMLGGHGSDARPKKIDNGCASYTKD
jgi:hypothetical protein